MFKKVTLCVCDICGRKEEATKRHAGYNDYDPDVPKGWAYSPVNKDVHVCDQCQQAFQKNR